MASKFSNTVSIKNKKASFNYEFIDKYEAGIQLKGTEIKSIRESKASIKEGYCAFKKGELFVYNIDITPYSDASFVNHEPKRPRKLLLHKNELEKLEKKIKDVGLTIVPTLLFINDSGKAKLMIALVKGKKTHDKRESLKLKDAKRQIDRAMKK
ncbi:MAG: SsrA-binding protein SmpB [Bacteroidetes bacterium]|nr:MAG: SsrA-binding protein SmpB [Bacteroidota bacterium]MBL1145282.1 SsrA-binding protein SmpB [Bacteroidota bacterium]MCB0803394.1 SsrA-binding protein SmpB [Flavobacteriales bacterium]NOG58079.1 SsrA-binding protein SmpB [Bacteroidota bacterium]